MSCMWRGFRRGCKRGTRREEKKSLFFRWFSFIVYVQRPRQQPNLADQARSDTWPCCGLRAVLGPGDGRGGSTRRRRP